MFQVSFSFSGWQWWAVVQLPKWRKRDGNLLLGSSDSESRLLVTGVSQTVVKECDPGRGNVPDPAADRGGELGSRCSPLIYLTCSLTLKPLWFGVCTEQLMPLTSKQLQQTTRKWTHFSRDLWICFLLWGGEMLVAVCSEKKREQFHSNIRQSLCFTTKVSTEMSQHLSQWRWCFNLFFFCMNTQGLTRTWHSN